jgi:hypothetical protein
LRQGSTGVGASNHRTVAVRLSRGGDVTFSFLEGEGQGAFSLVESENRTARRRVLSFFCRSMSADYTIEGTAANRLTMGVDEGKSKVTVFVVGVVGGVSREDGVRSGVVGPVRMLAMRRTKTSSDLRTAGFSAADWTLFVATAGTGLMPATLSIATVETILMAR